MAKTAKEQIGVELPEPEPVKAPEPEAAAESLERPEWLPEKFKSPEDLAQSYTQLQEEMRQRGEREREQSEQISALTAQMQELAAMRDQPQPQDQRELYLQELEAAYEASDFRRVAELQAWAAERMFESAAAQLGQQAVAEKDAHNPQAFMYAEYIDRTMRQGRDDWDEYKGEIGQVLAESPWMLPKEHALDPNVVTEALGRVYDSVKLRRANGDLAQLGASQEDVERARKLQAQTLSGANGRSEQPSQADAVLAGMKQALHGSSYTAFREG